jgi:hypothetical protein
MCAQFILCTPVHKLWQSTQRVAGRELRLILKPKCSG